MRSATHRRPLLWSVCVLAAALAMPVAAEITAVRDRSVLNENNDRPVVQQFVAQQFQSMQRAETASGIAAGQESLLAHRESLSSVRDAVETYSRWYAEAVAAEAATALDRAGEMTDVWMAEQLRLSTAIVAARVNNPALRPLLLDFLADSDMGVRYWALSGLQQARLAADLSGAAENSDSVRTVVEALRRAAAVESSALVATEMARATRNLPGTGPAWQVLQAIVDRRIELYDNWTVTDEHFDTTVIAELLRLSNAETIVASAALQREIVLTAARLFNAAYHRYSIGMNYQDNGEPLVLLTEKSEHDLRTLLVEGETFFFAATGDAGAAGRFQRALNQGDDVSSAYLALMGGGGMLNRRFELFPADTAPDATPLPRLSAPPASVVEAARTRAELGSKLLPVEL